MNFSINVSIPAFDDEIPKWVKGENEHDMLVNLINLWYRLMHNYLETLYTIKLYNEKITALAASYGQNVYCGDIPTETSHHRPLASRHELSVCLRKNSLAELIKDAKSCIVELTQDVNLVSAYYQSQLDLIKQISDYNHSEVPEYLELTTKILDYSRSIFIS